MGPSLSQVSAHVARHEAFAGRSARSQDRTGRREEEKWQAPFSYAAPRRKPVVSPGGTGGRLERVGAISKRGSTRKGTLWCVARHAPYGDADRTWLSRVGRARKSAARHPTRTGRRSGAGEGQRARRQRFVPARRNRGCRIRFRTPPAHRAAQAKRGASEGWTTRAASQDPRGELLRAKRGRGPEEGAPDRGKPSLSREPVEAV